MFSFHGIIPWLLLRLLEPATAPPPDFSIRRLIKILAELVEIWLLSLSFSGSRVDEKAVIVINSFLSG